MAAVVAEAVVVLTSVVAEAVVVVVPTLVVGRVAAAHLNSALSSGPAISHSVVRASSRDNIARSAPHNRGNLAAGQHLEQVR